MSRLRFFVLCGWLTFLGISFLGCGTPSTSGGGGSATTMTGGGGTITTGGGTGGAPCNPADCPPPSSECADPVCNPDGTCAEAPKPDGTLAAAQSSGDCNQKVCAAGVIQDQPDDSDLPDDGNTCTDDICIDGVPSHPFVAADSPCGAGGLSFCDGNGACAECTKPTQCPGDDTECHVRTCELGACGVANTAQGTPVASQTVGDCLQNVCDGSGALQSIPDDLDVADDGNECTVDACDNGAPVTTPAAKNTACGAGGAMFCDGAGICVGCTNASQCVAPGNACLFATCEGGVCGTANKADGTACNDNNACSQTDTCQAGVCTGSAPVICGPLDECHSAGTCDPMTGACSTPPKADGAACNDNNACTLTDTCQSGACVGGDPLMCALGGVCSSGSCVYDPIAYIKASNTGAYDFFGWSVALSADGNTLAVGARDEGSSATGVNGNQADNSAGSAGAVYVFTRSGATWSQQAYLKASNTGTGDRFGWSVALSADGNTLAVGAYGEASNATGVNGNQANNAAYAAGAVYVFTRSGATWSQQAYVKASNAGASDSFGYSVALSADGNTLAVGAYYEGSSATGVNGNQADNSASDAGAVYVFTRSGATWSQQAYLKASNTGVNDVFGVSVALSADGNTLAVGATNEASNATGVNGNQADNSALNAGAVYVFTRSGATWSQQAYLKASNTGASDYFGYSVALSADGNTLAVGAYREASNATGVNGNQADNSATNSGAVYVFARSGAIWSQQVYVKASNTGAGDFFGYSVALSADGTTLAVGAYGEASNATGVNGNQADNSASYAGAVYVFTRSGATWSQQAYVKASNTGASDDFSSGVALSADGNTLAVGAYLEASNATGVNGNQADNSASNAGAVYVY